MFTDCEKSLLCAEIGWLIIPIVDKMISEEYIEKIYSVIRERDTLLGFYYGISGTNSIAI